ncbi:zinc-binding alcohol dehydrogenase family protein [Bartonella sp. DGB2]|uniref:zinc-binding alcohol dehydrogenase family protein n=1 Tax=Bartonella sp. DGB2 TaxID=3388426 RepID=UPI00398FE5DA
MKAIAYRKNRPISHPQALEDLKLPCPKIGSADLLVAIRAVSVNPIDIKTRQNAPPFEKNTPRVLGFDASGTVIACGEAVKDFSVGDAVYYAGTLNRNGSNAEYQAVDHQLVAKKPQSLTFAQAASLPLTAITAYEMLFDRLCITKPLHPEQTTFLIVGGAGGVGSIALQLARLHSPLTLIATASRPDSQAWALKMGAHHTINHHQPFLPQLEGLGFSQVDFIFSTSHSDLYLPQYIEALAPQGRLGLIDSPPSFDISPLKSKSIAIHWEFMFTRSIFACIDKSRQGTILREIAALIDEGQLRSTMRTHFSPINAQNLQKAHALIEGGASIGKIVLENF